MLLFNTRHSLSFIGNLRFVVFLHHTETV
jgi:hypothetical protein